MPSKYSESLATIDQTLRMMYSFGIRDELKLALIGNTLPIIEYALQEAELHLIYEDEAAKEAVAKSVLDKMASTIKRINCFLRDCEDADMLDLKVSEKEIKKLNSPMLYSGTNFESGIAKVARGEDRVNEALRSLCHKEYYKEAMAEHGIRMPILKGYRGSTITTVVDTKPQPVERAEFSSNRPEILAALDGVAVRAQQTIKGCAEVEREVEGTLRDVRRQVFMPMWKNKIERARQEALSNRAAIDSPTNSQTSTEPAVIEGFTPVQENLVKPGF